jgi:hypothetical protein
VAGHIEQYRGKSGPSYRLRYTAGRDARGKRRQFARTMPQGTTRKQAERALAMLIADVERQAQTEGNKTPARDRYLHMSSARRCTCVLPSPYSPFIFSAT